MNKSITQDNQKDNQISKSIKRFFTRFHVSSALKASNAYKKKRTPVVEIQLLGIEFSRCIAKIYVRSLSS